MIHCSVSPLVYEQIRMQNTSYFSVCLAEHKQQCLVRHSCSVPCNWSQEVLSCSFVFFPLCHTLSSRPRSTMVFSHWILFIQQTFIGCRQFAGGTPWKTDTLLKYNGTGENMEKTSTKGIGVLKHPPVTFVPSSLLCFVSLFSSLANLSIIQPWVSEPQKGDPGTVHNRQIKGEGKNENRSSLGGVSVEGTWDWERGRWGKRERGGERGGRQRDKEEVLLFPETSCL